ncbi:MAG: class I SAM-dependent methyltransferase [Planctomycetes bacterium]|nr:class I SAM-dependent methyltransferase [Planctomycetota bacterium]
MSPASGREPDFTQFYARRGLTNPGQAVAKRSARALREYGARYFKGRLVELGCGDKNKQLLLGDLVSEYIGVDHADCIHDHTNIDILASAYATTLPDDSFDCALCTAVLEHLEEPLDALREAHRILKPQGVALYTVPLFFPLHEEPRDFYRYTRHGLRYLFEKAGFEVLELVPLSSYPLMALTQWNYYLQRVRRGVLKPFVRLAVACANLAAPALDRVLPQDERFTWMYLVVARKPGKGSS